MALPAACHRTGTDGLTKLKRFGESPGLRQGAAELTGIKRLDLRSRGAAGQGAKVDPGRGQDGRGGRGQHPRRAQRGRPRCGTGGQSESQDKAVRAVETVRRLDRIALGTYEAEVVLTRIKTIETDGMHGGEVGRRRSAR